MFKTQDALHVSYDASRSSSCAKCNYCATTCITGIQPTNIQMYDTCIDCGECVDACNRLQAKSGQTGLLHFEMGEKGRNASWRIILGEVAARFNWLVGALFVFGCVIMVWGIISQPEIVPQVSMAEQQRVQQIGRVCSAQCEKQQTACKAGSLEGCSRAAACKCECYLQQDPTNPASEDWRQCVKRSNASAVLLGLKHQ